MKKKAYETPSTEVVEMRQQAPLLVLSGQLNVNRDFIIIEEEW